MNIVHTRCSNDRSFMRMCVVVSKQFEFCTCNLLSFTFNRIINDRQFVIESSTRARVRIAHIDALLNKHYKHY